MNHKSSSNIIIPSIFRLIGIIICCAFLSRVLSLFTPFILLCTAAVFGDLLGNFLSKRHIKIYKIIIVHFFVYIGVSISAHIIESFVISSSSPTNDFLTSRIIEQISMLGLFYIIALIASLGYWRIHCWANYEAIFIFGSIIYALGGHRNYFLDAPKSTSSLAWDLGIEPQYLLIAIALLTSIFITIYLSIANTRQIFNSRDVIYQRSASANWRSFLATILCLAAFFGWGYYVNKIYSNNMTRTMNGVGQNTKEGESPLGFHSALGQTKQPAALIRLESGYNKNPWTPMLYVRESAISEFNGRELVTASTNFDQDIIRYRSFDTIRIDSAIDSKERQEVTQSIYLLSPHSTPFAIDYPITMRQLKNPDTQRFVGAYQVLSQAPTKPIDNIIANNVGDSKWSNEQRQHYLRAPGSLASQVERLALQVGESIEKMIPDSNGEDLRYKLFSDRLTAGVSAPVKKAETIANYLSEHSTYTRAPGHDITKGGDPVAPYLFSEEMKGYCVHFAHAAVYLMRLAGIPSRIATGYLTDLNYSKDGHILLTMADRHAWPEIYVENIGWVVVDVSPAHADNEQPPVPDEKLLEELMSKLDPAEPLVSPMPASQEKSAVIDFLKWFSIKQLLVVIGSLFALLVMAKLIIRYCFIFAINTNQLIRLSYFSLLASIADLGQIRSYGETRQEFSSRISKSTKLDLKDITMLYERLRYQKDCGQISADVIRTTRDKALISISTNYSRWRMVLAFLNTRSIFSLFRL